ncbi:RES family NAD+ phosphorylase [Nostocales cyanobacterium LEGE 12452]|nr:RES family NAD+ phosphorylase [Nostocales cyanobacterium LEGE 12452]
MQIYRIASTSHIRDLSGYGAAAYGGRWNDVGRAVVYTGSSIALSAWEVRVHLHNNILPRDDLYSVVFLTIPDSAVIDVGLLESDWKVNQAYTRYLGHQWLDEGKHLCLRVPSSIVHFEYNYLLNPAHPMMKDVVINGVEPFIFDPRTFSY